MRQEILLTLIFVIIIIVAIVLGQYNPNLQTKISQSAIPGKEINAAIDVYNGSGRSKLAERVTNTLRTKGIDAYNKGNAQWQTYNQTLVFSRKSKDIKIAQAVAEKLGINNAFFLESDVEAVNDVTVILGYSYKEIK